LEVLQPCYIFGVSINQKLAAMETTKLRNGLVVVAKSYTNQTQAEKARKKIAFDYGIETYVRARFPFYLVLVEQPK